MGKIRRARLHGDDIANDRPWNSSSLLVTRSGANLLAIVALGGVLLFAASQQGMVESLSSIADQEALSMVIEDVGPLAVVVLLAVAVVVSPIPSGPVAMAAGALFGPVEGGALTAIGAVLGALVAFSQARTFGYRPLSTSSLPLANWLTRPRTEAKLALVVLISRLIPFISFDAVSYVAGLTTIRVCSFAMATTLGVLPASFAFAALGAGMATMDNAVLIIGACGITVILPSALLVSPALSAGRVQLSGSKT